MPRRYSWKSAYVDRRFLRSGSFHPRAVLYARRIVFCRDLALDLLVFFSACHAHKSRDTHAQPERTKALFKTNLLPRAAGRREHDAYRPATPAWPDATLDALWNPSRAVFRDATPQAQSGHLRVRPAAFLKPFRQCNGNISPVAVSVRV